jgi:hypothetical protein
MFKQYLSIIAAREELARTEFRKRLSPVALAG